MRCVGLCTANSYDINGIISFYKDKYNLSIYRQVVHIERMINNEKVHLFYFSYGTIVIWGNQISDDLEVLNEVKDFEIKPLSVNEDDEFSYDYGNEFKVNGDHITLPNNDKLTKLAISHAIAQSSKLAVFEQLIQKRIDEMEYIPAGLAVHGKILLSKKQIRKKMGEIFLERSYVNLHFDLLDTPEFFWEHVELEPTYLQVAKYLELSTRVEVLNKKLNVVRELYEMLGNEVDSQHESRLEWIIIVLIFIEVCFYVGKEIFHFY